MSDSIDKKEVEVAKVEPKAENDFVTKKAYEGVSSDMHKFKGELKGERARANELEAQLKAMSEEKMREQNQWKELFEAKSEELESEKVDNESKRSSYLDAAKKSALKMELGKINDDYLVHANISDIKFNDDGTINRDSLHDVANNFREKHSVLMPTTSVQTSTSAPATNDLRIKEMTRDQLMNEMKGKTIEERVAIMDKYKS